MIQMVYKFYLTEKEVLMTEALSQFGFQLQKKLEQLKIGYENGKEFREFTADFCIETGPFSKSIIFFVKKVDKETLKFNEKIKKNFKHLFRKNIILVTEKMSKFWLDVTAMYTQKHKNISFINISNKTIVGKIPDNVFKVFEQVSFPGSPSSAFNHYPLPEISSIAEEIDEKSQNVWLQELSDHFKKYLVANGYYTSKVKNSENLSIDLVNDRGLIFVPEVTEELLDKGLKALESLPADIQKLTIVGVTAKKNVLDSTRDGISVYALHRNYQWVSGGRKDRDSSLEDFLNVHSNINLVKYKYPFSLKPILIPGFTILLLFIFGIIGIQFLLSREGFIIFLIFGITLFVSILLGGFSCKYMKVGQKEYTPAIIYAGSSGLILATVFWLISTRYLPYEDIGYFQNENLYLIVQSVMFIDFSIAVGIFYTFFTKTPSSYIQPLPEKYNEVVAGKNLEVIKAAIYSWDKGWALTIPDFASKIVIRTVNIFVGYAVILDTLFEERWVSIGEMSSVSATYRSYQEAKKSLIPALNMVEKHRWDYNFPHSPRFDKFRDKINFIRMAVSCICPNCAGSGTVICSNCGGTGKVTVYETENYTDSDGQSKTRTVSREKICYTCGGSGRVTCSRCSGTGSIMIFPVLNCKRYHKQHKDCIDPTTGKGLKKVIYKAKAKVLIETSIKDGLIHFDKIFAGDISQEAANLTQKVTTEVEQTQKTSIHVIRQRLRLIEIPISEVDYNYKDKAYRLWVYGYDNKVHTLKSPINLFRLLITIIVVLIILVINIITFWNVIENL